MCSFGQIFFPKHVKNDSTRNLELFSAKKTAGNNTEYSTNETILKIHHFGKCLAHAKWAV